MWAGACLIKQLQQPASCLWLMYRERRRLRQQQGLEADDIASADSAAIARCALRPGVAGDASCEKAADGFTIRGMLLLHWVC